VYINDRHFFLLPSSVSPKPARARSGFGALSISGHFAGSSRLSKGRPFDASPKPFGGCEQDPSPPP
jgi:hypothetical protein